MIIAICGLVALALAQAWLLIEMRRGQRLMGRIEEMREKQWDRERQQLLDRIMYLAGQPWSPPPMPELAPEPVEEDYEPDALDVPLATEALYYVDIDDLTPSARV